MARAPAKPKKLTKAGAWEKAASDMVSGAESLVEARDAINEALELITETASGNLQNLRQEFLSTNEGKELINAVDELVAKYNTARSDMESAIEGYSDWLENMPESLKSGATGEKVEACSECEPGDEAEFGEIVIKDDGDIEFNDNFDDLVDTAGDLESQDLPAGFGKD